LECAADWRNLIHNKAQDTGFGHLVEDMARRGWDARNPMPILDGMICEAHHRLVAAILLCLDEIPVVTAWEHWNEDRTFGPSGHNHFGFEGPVFGQPYPIEL
jgi:hypothetical protein